jgi:two-component system chemotaxis sensor kinase CheA
MQKTFLTMAFGGEDAYAGRDLASAHAGLVEKGLNDSHFDRVMKCLRQTLEELGVGEDLMIDVLTVAERTRSDVLGLNAGNASSAEALEADSEIVEESESAPEPAPQASAAGAEPDAETKRDTGAVKESAIANQSIRVNVGLLENLMNLVSEMVLTRNALLQMVRGQADSEMNIPLQRLSQTTTELQEGVMKTRMQPIGNAWNKLPRIIRDLSIDLGKKIKLEMLGADTELDRQVLELIKDPLTHMVRNSADHGIEATADRAAAGKREEGTVTLNAYHEGGHIIIEINDDGRGINIEKVKEKAIANGMSTEAELEGMSDQQIQQFIMKPGFSTAEQVTNVSGRGVGMDVVRTNIEKIGGTIELKSVEGKGSSFTIKIPLTLAIVSALIVSCAGERFAVPQISVVELVRASGNSEHKIEKINGAPVLRLRERLLPLVSLRDLLKLEGPTASEPVEADDGAGEPDVAVNGHEGDRGDDVDLHKEESENLILVTNVGALTFGILVDKVYDTEEIVVKPVAPILRDISLYSGNTILGDGSVVLILDPNGVAAGVGEVAVTESDAAEVVSSNIGKSEEKVALLIFRAQSEEPKSVPLSLVARLEEIDVSTIEYSDGAPVVQYRGQLMPLVTMAANAELRKEGRQPVVVFSDEDRSMGLVVDAIEDIVENKLSVELAGEKPGILGSAVVDGKATDVIDAGYYVSVAHKERFGGDNHKPYGSKEGSQELLLVDDSAFFRNLLTPLLTLAGYHVTTVESADEALTMRDNGAQFDIIISDIEMPGMDGFSFAKSVKSEGPWQAIPLVALSSHATPTDIDRGRAVGFDDYVAKFDREAILSSLSETLSTVRGAA